jgi:hypothetical protein
MYTAVSTTVPPYQYAAKLEPLFSLNYLRALDATLPRHDEGPRFRASSWSHAAGMGPGRKSHERSPPLLRRKVAGKARCASNLMSGKACK